MLFLFGRPSLKSLDYKARCRRFQVNVRRLTQWNCFTEQSCCSSACSWGCFYRIFKVLRLSDGQKLT